MLKVRDQVIEMQNNRIYSDFDDMFAFWLKSARELFFSIRNICVVTLIRCRTGWGWKRQDYGKVIDSASNSD